MQTKDSSRNSYEVFVFNLLRRCLTNDFSEKFLLQETFRKSPRTASGIHLNILNTISPKFLKKVVPEKSSNIPPRIPTEVSPMTQLKIRERILVKFSEKKFFRKVFVLQKMFLS